MEVNILLLTIPQISDFYYKLHHSTVPNGKILSKWQHSIHKNCTFWKNIVYGFSLSENTDKICIYNDIISAVSYIILRENSKLQFNNSPYIKMTWKWRWNKCWCFIIAVAKCRKLYPIGHIGECYLSIVKHLYIHIIL